MSTRIAVLAGDGIGPEIVGSACEVLPAVAPDVVLDERLVGGASLDAHGVALTDEAFEACATSDAVLLGAVGGPRWEAGTGHGPHAGDGLVRLRTALEFANLRDIRPSSALLDSGPVRRERVDGASFLIVRELLGGLYFGRKEREPERAVDECVYTVDGGLGA